MKIWTFELETLLRSVYHAAAGRGMLGHELRELLKKDLASELDHATFLADKIVALGGEVRIGPAMPRRIWSCPGAVAAEHCRRTEDHKQLRRNGSTRRRSLATKVW